MYSIILMTAMSTAPNTTEFFGLFQRGESCHGSSCHGNACYGSCTGSGNGCTGHSSDRSFGWRIRAFFDRGESCHGSSCYGSCHGKTLAGAGSCQGKSYNSCTGGQGGSCFGGSGGTLPFSPGIIPNDGGGYARPSPAVSGYFPADSNYTLGTPIPIGQPYIIGSGTPMAPPRIESFPARPPVIVPEDRTSNRPPVTSAANRATVVVKLPVDAKLYAEGKALNLTTAERVFVSPPLPADTDFIYVFRAEYDRAGETIAQSKKVTVRAGKQSSVEFIDLTSAKTNPPVTLPSVMPSSKEPTVLAGTTTSNTKDTTPTIVPPPPANSSERARITVKLPPGATLYVDGKKNERTDAVRDFGTPPLPAGQEFAYLMKAEVMKDGRPETQTTKVTFRAGEIVTVDFTQPSK
jgi:uncharacterized protein (TIGR03000 family)